MLIDLNNIRMVLLIGASGSGKSTFAKRHFRKEQVLSSDFCRVLVSDREEDQEATGDAFQVLNLILEKRLARGLLTVVDATSVQAWARESLLAIAARHDAPAAGIVFHLPLDHCLSQNKTRRGRFVDEGVVERQIEELESSLAALPQEGFRSIYFLTSPAEVRQVEVDIKN